VVILRGPPWYLPPVKHVRDLLYPRAYFTLLKRVSHDARIFSHAARSLREACYEISDRLVGVLPSPKPSVRMEQKQVNRVYVFDGVQLGDEDRDAVMYRRTGKEALSIQITDECCEAES